MPDSAGQQSSHLCCPFVQRAPPGLAGKTFSASGLTSHLEKNLSQDNFLIAMPPNSASVEFVSEKPGVLSEVETESAG